MVLGHESLWTRVKQRIAQSQGQQEIAWSRHVRKAELTQAIERLLTEEPDPRVRTWLRVCLGGERPVDVARSHGYANGSAVHQVIRRLEIRRQQDMDLARRLEQLENTVRSVKS